MCPGGRPWRRRPFAMNATSGLPVSAMRNDLPKPAIGRRSRSYRAVLMANVFTAVPPEAPPPLSGAARSVLPLADLFMIAMWSRPATGSLDKTWVTPATLALAAACVAAVVVVLVALVAGAVHWPSAVGAIVAIACTALGVGAASVVTVGLDQRRTRR